MPKDILHWGRSPQLVFQSINEYYRALGHLTNSEAYSISYEYNKKNGSYSDACRIHILAEATNVPQAFQEKKTTYGRINCNEYVENLIKNHHFIREGKQIYCIFEDVIKTIPDEYISDFAKGYSESIQKGKIKDSPDPSKLTKNDATLSKTEIPRRPASPTKTLTGKSKTKKDYLKEQIKNTNVGNRGEKIVFDVEKRKLEDAVKKGIIDSVDKYLVWESLNNDSAGYDILSFDVGAMKPIYIEVKTTEGNKFTPFYMSEGELKFSRENPNEYRLYRLFELKDDFAKYFEIAGDVSRNPNLKINATNYIVNLK